MPMGLPRIGLVFPFWKCDKENQIWREDPPASTPCQGSAPSAGSSPSVNASVNQKKKPALSDLQHPTQCDWPVNMGHPEIGPEGLRAHLSLRFSDFCAIAFGK